MTRSMNIRVLSVAPRPLNKTEVKVSFCEHDSQFPEFSNRAIVDVFIDQTDSLAELRTRAIAAARELFRSGLGTDAAETYPAGEIHGDLESPL
jgi:hypothetical protein